LALKLVHYFGPNLARYARGAKREIGQPAGQAEPRRRQAGRAIGLVMGQTQMSVGEQIYVNFDGSNNFTAIEIDAKLYPNRQEGRAFHGMFDRGRYNFASCDNIA